MKQKREFFVDALHIFILASLALSKPLYVLSSNAEFFVAHNTGIISEFKKNIQYPIRIEEEAFNTELVYKRLMGKT